MPQSLENHDKLLKAVGARIKSELNDLKRTPESCAEELGLPFETVQRVLDGLASPEATQELIDTLGRHYPIDKSDLMLLEDDTNDGALIMRAADSLASARVFDRADAGGARTPYYEYRDTAMSRLAPFRPEWIKEERVVADSEAENPDVVFNNGHLLHQITFFVGPVNFYYKDADGAHCVEMDTGDANYIMPFYPHSFTSRDASQKALIIAVTFGGEVRRAQKELYALGERGEKFHLNFRKKTPRVALLEAHLANARMSPDSLDLLLSRAGSTLTASRALDYRSDLSNEEYDTLGDILDVQPSDLMASKFRTGDDVKVVYRKDREPYPFPSGEDPHYLIRTLAQHHAMPLVKSMDVEVKGTRTNQDAVFLTSLHTYIYNYGEHEVIFTWAADGNSHEVILAPEDSAYLQPFVEHSFVATKAKKPGSLLLVSLPGFMGQSAIKEFSYFESATRVVRETKKWFD